MDFRVSTGVRVVGLGIPTASPGFPLNCNIVTDYLG